MSRTTYQRHEELVTEPLPISLGGTAAKVASQALANLQLVNSDHIGQPNGITPLDADGKIPIQFLPPADVYGISVNGALTGFGGVTQTFKISDYDFDTVYTISCDSGTVSRTDDTITFTPANSNGLQTVTVNGNLYSVNVTKSMVMPPVILSPIDNAVDVTLTPQLVGDAPVVIGLPGNFIASHWEVSQSIDFTVNVLTFDVTTGDKRLCSITEALVLDTNYYVRVRYETDTLGLSEWSTVLSFHTVSSIYAPPSNEEVKLTLQNPIGSEILGWSVSIDNTGQRIIGSTSGFGVAIFVKNSNSWELERTIIQADVGSTSLTDFGTCVTISGDGLRIAFNDPQNNGGKAYIFLRTGTIWSLEAEVVGSDVGINDQFGAWSIMLTETGDRLIVGDYINDDKGAAYIFSRSGTVWTQEAKLSDVNGAAGDMFGSCVSIDSLGTRVIISSQRAENNGVLYAGAAYIFSRSGTVWTQEAKLSATDPISGDNFGVGAVISGDGTRIIVAAPYAAPDGINHTGKAYVYSRSGVTWSYEATLFNDDYLTVDPNQNGGFGDHQIGLNFDGTVAVIGCPCSTEGVNIEAGSAYVFTRVGVTWTQYIRFTASDQSTEEYFAEGVTISRDGTKIAIGSGGADIGGAMNAGAIYVYS
jgi:hypothetical protein